MGQVPEPGFTPETPQTLLPLLLAWEVPAAPWREREPCPRGPCGTWTLGANDINNSSNSSY